MDGEDVRVVEGGEGLGLLLETVEAVGTGSAISSDHLDGDVAREAGVPGAVDLTHRSHPDRGQKLVRAETVAR